MNIGTYLNQLAVRLATASDSPMLDAQVLVADLTGLSRVHLLAHPELELSAAQLERLQSGAARLLQGEPLPYVLGHWEFYGMDLEVSSAVLIPRPETELLVERALSWLKNQIKPCRAADIGTGSGCIAAALAFHQPDLQVIAADISAAALSIAQRNIRRHGLADRIHLLQADLLAPLAESKASAPTFQLICANLPYIPTETLLPLRVARWEPYQALWGGQDGLEYIRRLVEQSHARLAPGGLLLLEIESSLGSAVEHICQKAFPRAAGLPGQIQVIQDLSGLDRMVAVQLPRD